MTQKRQKCLMQQNATHRITVANLEYLNLFLFVFLLLSCFRPSQYKEEDGTFGGSDTLKCVCRSPGCNVAFRKKINSMKPFVAPEEAAFNLIKYLQYFHLSCIVGNVGTSFKKAV